MVVSHRWAAGTFVRVVILVFETGLSFSLVKLANKS